MRWREELAPSTRVCSKVCEPPRFAAARHLHGRACRVCDIVLSSSSNAKHHEALHSSSNGVFVCSVCYVHIPSRVGRNNHELILHGYKRSGPSITNRNANEITQVSAHEREALGGDEPSCVARSTRLR